MGEECGNKDSKIFTLCNVLLMFKLCAEFKLTYTFFYINHQQLDIITTQFPYFLNFEFLNFAFDTIFPITEIVYTKL